MARVSGRAQRLVWAPPAVAGGCGGRGVAIVPHVVPSPPMWSLPLSKFELSHRMATKSFKRERPSEQQGSHPSSMS